MSKNMGTIDRVLRLLVAAGLFAWAFLSGAAAAGGVAFWLALGVGAVMLVTAIVSRCPAYRLFGLRTCRAS
jgi:hypothetical protein